MKTVYIEKLVSALQYAGNAPYMVVSPPHVLEIGWKIKLLRSYGGDCVVGAIAPTLEDAFGELEKEAERWCNDDSAKD